MTTWRDFAACLDVGTDAFFALGNGAAARKFCLTQCLVRDACLKAALEFEGDSSRKERHGIVGGTYPSERYKMAKAAA